MKKYRRTIECIPYSFVPNHTATIEALTMTRLSGREFRIVLFIMRQTDGYLREEDQISPDFFARKTGIDKRNLAHALRRLIHSGIVRRVDNTSPPTYTVNPPSQWHKSIFVKIDETHSSDLTRKIVENDENQLRPKDNLKKTNYRYRSRENNNNRDKYIQGEYGHMVRR